VSSSPHVTAASIGSTLPDVETRWKEGSHHLEVGCGVGNALLSIVLTYPNVTAVGIEIDSRVAVEATRRARILEIDERVEVRNMDACELMDAEKYDTVQWSQFFFPDSIRRSVLVAIHRALKPGGYLFMPWFYSEGNTTSRRWIMFRSAWKAILSGSSSFFSFLNDAVGDSFRRRKKEMRSGSIHKFNFTRWGVPVKPVRMLESEAREIGFKIVRAPLSPVNQFAMTRGFLLVQK
jgi:SAM-dependent methyltransferase